jgi:glycosyltransferase 2 family protein
LLVERSPARTGRAVSSIAVDGSVPTTEGETGRSAKRTKWLVNAGKFALSLLAIVVVLRAVDLPSAWHRMQQQNFWLALLGAALMVGQVALGGLRWHLILRRLGAQMRLSAALRLFYIAVFFNACLWGAVAGDVVRTWLAHRNAVDMRTAVNSVLLDRVAPLCAVALLVLATLPLFAQRVGIGAAVIPGVLSLAGIAGIFIVATLHRLPSHWQHNRLVRLVQSLGSATRLIFLAPSAAMPMLSIAVAGQIVGSVSAFLIAKSLAIHIGLLDCLMLMQPVTLVTALPISIGGWGVREATIVALFALVGVSSEAALALSVQIGLIGLIVSLPGGVLWLLLGSHRRALTAERLSFGVEAAQFNSAARKTAN